jgi:hypothetical protein
VRNLLARTRNLSDATNLWKVSQVMRDVAEQGIHGHCGLFVVLGNIVEDILSILFRFWCPADFYSSFFLINSARRAANRASIMSFVLPDPACIDSRTVATLSRKNSS